MAELFQLVPLYIYFVLLYFILYLYSIFQSASFCGWDVSTGPLVNIFCTSVLYPLFWFPLSISFFLRLGYFNFTLIFYLNSIYLSASSYGWSILTGPLVNRFCTLSFILIPSTNQLLLMAGILQLHPQPDHIHCLQPWVQVTTLTIYPITHHRWKQVLYCIMRIRLW